MSVDEHGMPLPPEHIPMPLWIEHEQFVDTVRDADDQEVNLWDMPEFFVHAANNIIPCRDIVRRLAENEEMTADQWVHLIVDAKELWSEMQREKGGGDA